MLRILSLRALSRFIAVFLPIAFAVMVVRGQSLQKEAINSLMTSVKTLSTNRAVEKLYIQTDKDNYIAGDTLWFKAYLLDAISLAGTEKSGLLYVELTNDSNQLIQRSMVPVYGGLTFGNITLDPKTIPQGSYTLSAYTNWMLNFGEHAAFRKQIYVSDVGTDDWLVDYTSLLNKSSGKNNVTLAFRLRQYDLMPVGLRQLQLKVSDEKRSVMNTKVESSVEGLARINFDLPEKTNTKSLAITIQDLRKGLGNRKLTLPLYLRRLENTDLQFMPEGGTFISDVPNRIAYKALSDDGLGLQVSGKLYDSENNEVGAFESNPMGMGSFQLTPKKLQQYTARLIFSDGTTKSYLLPIPLPSGISMEIKNEASADSILITLHASTDLVVPNKPYYLMGQARGIISYGASFVFKGPTVNLWASKENFPTGITRFSLLSSDQKAISERVVYVDHQDQLRIEIAQDKEQYAQRDSITFRLKVSDVSGNPVQGSFSLAVTDDGQVKTDSIKTQNIISQILIKSELKGNIENPGYYRSAVSEPKKWKDLDLLLLTQGWVGYSWNDLYTQKAMKFVAEPQFQIRGKYANLFNKPLVNAKITLLGSRPTVLSDTNTNAEGIFSFRGFLPTDSSSYFIQGVNQRGKKGTGGIVIDEFAAPKFLNNPRMALPWYVNTDTAGLLYIQQKKELVSTMEKLTGKNMLKEVQITGKKVVRDSKNLNGPGGADIVIDEEALQMAKKTSLLDLLIKNVPGFGITSKKGFQFYAVNFSPAHIIMDGIESERFKNDTESFKDFQEATLRAIDAEDIKGIEVMKTGKNQLKYISEFLDPMIENPFNHVFIEVTTRGGHGPFFKKPIGIAVVRPLPTIQTKVFYAPKYPLKSKADMTDVRSTVYWAPHIFTDKFGTAKITFYAADNPGNYTFIMEGSDMSGSLGFKQGSLKIQRQTGAGF
ncbi:MAG: hypothetical protein EOO20_09430 [Chryseobacterium sp.]|nr:MAG: hypothetical protein EOO20_09430 [Chryseobacterium sp.]